MCRARLQNKISGMEFFAHINRNTNEKQTLLSHSRGVAEFAKEFACGFGNEDWIECAALFHDLGKENPEWQKYLLSGGKRRGNHSESGAQFVYKKSVHAGNFAKVIPYIIAGHHAGLPDWHEGSGNSLKSLLASDKVQIDNAFTDSKSAPLFQEPHSPPFGTGIVSKYDPKTLTEHFHLWIRMLYSCLVDADFLDTERFMNQRQFAMRKHYASLETLKQKLDSYMQKKRDGCAPSTLNEIREKIYGACLSKANGEAGFYSLNVPTGGGKTLASMAFALSHAIKKNKKRIIVAIPYTSIIEQTANVYKWGSDDVNEIAERKKTNDILFGDENVLEHHSNFNFDDDADEEKNVRYRLAAENWDAPIIVTTNVQLFESLFNAHSSPCRKNHNIVNSVIILDEVQMLPAEYLQSILSVLRGLVQCFGVTVVLCTATQPALEGEIGADSARFSGIPKNRIRPIIENPSELSEKLKRVEINTELAKKKLNGWESLAAKLETYNQVLCIVQTRKDCRTLYAILHDRVPEGTYHLSALMCAEERSEIISEIKEKLTAHKTVRVVSTQLIECGVDIDFPVVFRALAGLDSIAQSAGRCNREGKLERGTLFLFSPPKDAPPGLLRKAADTTKELLRKNDYRLELSPELYREYFTNYFRTVNCFDTCEFSDAMQSEKNELQFQFRSLSDRYHLIEKEYQAAVYVRYKSDKTGKDDKDLLQRLQAGEIDTMLFRKLSRYAVNLSLTDIRQLVNEGRVLQTENVFMQRLDDESLYKNGIGFAADSLPSFSTYVY